jgi:hypothetical protein
LTLLKNVHNLKDERVSTLAVVQPAPKKDTHRIAIGEPRRGCVLRSNRSLHALALESHAQSMRFAIGLNTRGNDGAGTRSPIRCRFMMGDRKNGATAGPTASEGWLHELGLREERERLLLLLLPLLLLCALARVGNWGRRWPTRVPGSGIPNAQHCGPARARVS